MKTSRVLVASAMIGAVFVMASAQRSWAAPPPGNQAGAETTSPQKALTSSQPDAARSPETKLEGSWTETDTGKDRSFTSLLTFTAEQSDPHWHGETTKTYFNSSVPLLTSGHGAWLKTGENRYTVALRFLDASGAFVRVRVHEVIEVNDALDHYAGTFETKILDAEGNVLETLTGTVEGNRIQVCTNLDGSALQC